ncbi:hypothetical protein CBS101457_005815 [Exobasidium rhododendri]|nr:hypothetical protein CBS101457_005815 [Exobasidium rhododendri]
MATFPFNRAQHIGSLLRPSHLLDVRMQFEKEKLSYDQLKPVEDKAIVDVIQLQKDAGAQTITDGEFRRHMFYDGFHDHLDGFVLESDPPREIFKMYVPDVKAFLDSPTARPAATFICKSPLKRKSSLSPYEKEFKYLIEHVKPEDHKYIKFTTAAPEWFHLRHSSQYAFTKEAYPQGESGYFGDIAKAYQQEIKALYDLGCRNIQVDDPLLAYFCDSSMLEGMKKEGINPEDELSKYIKLYNDCFEGKPKDMSVGIHLCRGNFVGGRHFSEGSYSHIAKRLFSEIQADVYYLEYDTERAGTFEPLAEVPKNKFIVLGVISSKLGQLESADAMESKVRSAAEIMAKGAGTSTEEALQRLAISPQCGFASHSEGNDIAHDDMIQKLRLVRQVAHNIWPKDA